MKLRPVDRKTRIKLDDDAAQPPKSAPDGAELAQRIKRQEKRIGELQKALYADRRHAVLIVLQGRDAAGKDGTVKHVFKAVDPQGCMVTSFGVPSAEETRHDYLWRIHPHVPPRGVIGIFNRSHYEDVIVPRVHKTISPAELERRYDQINDFERMLVENGTVVLKFFLHISKDEQRRRLEDRLANPKKNWKFRPGDLEDRALWDEYTSAYRAALSHCSTKWAPWYVVPADHKKVRNLLVSRVITERLEALKLRYPKAAKEVVGLKVE